MKLLLDTDIGSDIDDAICLAYLLAHPDCDLLGITTVSGEPHKRAMLASAICQAAGKQTPILPGAPGPLLVPNRQPLAPQAAALGPWPHRRDFPAGHAVGLMRETIRRYPGEVTLLAIGPMTNVALLFALDPEIPSLLGGLTMMIGAFDRPGDMLRHEWNALNDPHAAAMVYRAPVPVHRSVGLDVTLQVQMDAAEVRRRFQSPPLRPVLAMAEVWFQSRPTVTFHDPLAAVSLFAPDVCAYTRGQVDVELLSPQLGGMTYFRPGPAGPHEVALGVDPARFFEEYFGATGG